MATLVFAVVKAKLYHSRRHVVGICNEKQKLMIFITGLLFKKFVSAAGLFIHFIADVVHQLSSGELMNSEQIVSHNTEV